MFPVCLFLQERFWPQNGAVSCWALFRESTTRRENQGSGDAQAHSAKNSDRFATREAATKQLLLLGDLAEAPLREALQKQASAEARRRIETILQQSSDVAVQPVRLQALRAIEVLEKIGSVEARKVLRSLAKGTPDCLITREARGTLAHLEK